MSSFQETPLGILQTTKTPLHPFSILSYHHAAMALAPKSRDLLYHVGVTFLEKIQAKSNFLDMRHATFTAHVPR